MPSDKYELHRLYKEMMMLRAKIAVIRKTLPPEEAAKLNEQYIQRLIEVDDEITMLENL